MDLMYTISILSDMSGTVAVRAENVDTGERVETSRDFRVDDGQDIDEWVADEAKRNYLKLATM